MKSFIIAVVTGAAGIVNWGTIWKEYQESIRYILHIERKICYGKFAHNKEKFCTLKAE
jgi:hypothetical protein